MSEGGGDNHVGDNDSQDQLTQMLVEFGIETQTRGAAKENANSQNLAAKLPDDDSQKNLEQLKQEGLDTIDRISDLPEFIVHHILSFLEFSLDRVRSSVLSKKWFALTASFPILDFCVLNFTRSLRESGIPSNIYNDMGHVRDIFFKYVDYTMSRFCEQNVRAHRFELNVLLGEPTDVDMVDKWLRLILRKDVQALEISFAYEPAVGTLYCMPNILLSASSLTSLSINNCELPSSLIVDDVKFKSLKHLHLENIRIDEEVIKRVTTSCPLLDELTVKNCDGFKRFCVDRHRSLQIVIICYNPGLERIDIEAPNLCLLYLEDIHGSGVPCMNLASCRKLTTLYLEHFSLPSIEFANFLSNFPLLENVFLISSWQHNELKLSSPSLRTLVLIYNECDLEKVDINAPNLLLFQCSSICSGHSDIPNPMVRDSTESKARMECYPYKDADTLWFDKLRRFLDKKNYFKILKLHISANVIVVDELKAIESAPYELEHVELEVDTIEELSDYEDVIDAVLWCCRPRSLTLIFDFPFVDLKERSHIVKYTYEKLLEQEDERQTNIQIVLSSSSKPRKHFSNLNSLLTALPHDRLRQTITYIKDEADQEAVTEMSNVC